MFEKQIGKIVLLLRVWFIAFLCVFTMSSGKTYIGHAQEISANNWQIFLPIVRNGLPPFQTSSKFIGIYMQEYWTDDAVSTKLPSADSLAGKKHSVVGWFIDLQDIAFTSQNDIRTNNFYRQLEALWKNGYISFININIATVKSVNTTNEKCPFSASAYQIARGDCDNAIRRMAELYKQWISAGAGRIAFLAPLPEMNGVNADGSVWTSYGGDAANFKLAYQRIVNIFSEAGVGRGQVWWVFAPNGWSKEGHEFEKYYPGGSLVDMIGFSSYNYGYCHVAIPWQRWENFDTLFAPYLERIRQMDPSKPIILAQTGTTAEYSKTDEVNIQQKNNWLRQNYEYLAQQPQVIGILYYDYDQSSWGECNWRILPGTTYQGYTDGARNSVYKYLNVQSLQSILP